MFDFISGIRLDPERVLGLRTVQIAQLMGPRDQEFWILLLSVCAVVLLSQLADAFRHRSFPETALMMRAGQPPQTLPSRANA